MQFEVMVYGSMPLKTYLPDGDVDLTVVCPHSDVKSLATSISRILKKAKSDKSGIMDVEDIHAKVKVIRCLVQHVAVDISFNQMAGLNSLCILEQIDQHIGRDHLFKRSIILTKAWCFYESHLLGSRYGLLSTYALEILVLYIINLFHYSLDGPLAVLYKFLDYYSTFDWDRYCISLNGPVDINFLPEMVVDTSATKSTDLLLDANFLESSIRSFSVPENVCQSEPQGFQTKYLNIIDPLKVTNNLGFSISQGGFYRVTSAFSYGSHNLRDILQQPVESIGDGIMMFFPYICRNIATVEVLDNVAVLESNSGMSQFSHLKGDYDCPIEFLNYKEWYINSSLDIFQQPNLELNHWPIQSQSTVTQIAHSIYYPLDGYAFASSSLHPSLCPAKAYPLFSSLLSTDVTAASVGQSSYISSVSSEGKSKLSASAPPFVSSAVGKKIKCAGTGLFVPKVKGKRRSKSKEACVYSPNAQWTNLPEMRRECEGLSLGTSMENQLANTPSELDTDGGSSFSSRVKLNLPPSCEKPAEPDKHGESGCFDLSLEDFPLLPTRQKTILSGEVINVQLTKDSSLKSCELDQGGKSSWFDLSLEHFPLLPSRNQETPVTFARSAN